MITAEAKRRAAAFLGKGRAQLSGLKQAHLSPLSGIVLAGLAATTAASALFALYALLGPIDREGAATAPDWTPPTLSAVELDPPKPASADVETLARPIFSKNRKPLPKSAGAPADVAAVSDAAGGLSVTAIVRHKGTARAFVISGDAPGGAWRSVGDAVDTWTVSAITPAEVVLQSGGQFGKIKLYGEQPPRPAAETPAAAPAAPPAAPPPPP